jgi:2-hydroxychromene-2-carboxylate isomerase
LIQATLYSDAACPWAYSESPALRVIEWRYAEQLDWRLVLIALTEDAQQYVDRGYTTARMAQTPLYFRRWGMPFAIGIKDRVSATARGCRAVIVTRIDYPGREFAAFRALQLANFNTPLILEDEEQLAAVLDTVPGLDGAAIVARLNDDDVSEQYAADKAEARSAEGSAAELQGKTRISDGPVRYTAPSVVFERDGQRLVAGGFQPVEAYDILVCNLDPGLSRREPPETPAPLLAYFDSGLTTQEVAALMTHSNDAPDPVAAERALIELVGAGEAHRQPLGDDAVWLSADSPAIDGVANLYTSVAAAAARS